MDEYDALEMALRMMRGRRLEMSFGRTPPESKIELDRAIEQLQKMQREFLR